MRVEIVSQKLTAKHTSAPRDISVVGHPQSVTEHHTLLLWIRELDCREVWIRYLLLRYRGEGRQTKLFESPSHEWVAYAMHRSADELQ